MRITLLALATALAACTGPVDDPADGAVTSDGGLYDVLYATTPSPPTAGATELALILEEVETGALVSSAALAIEPWMPSMDHGIMGEVTVHETDDGEYLATWEYSMPGYWEVTIDIDAEAGTDVVVLDFDVQ